MVKSFTWAARHCIFSFFAGSSLFYIPLHHAANIKRSHIINKHLWFTVSAFRGSCFKDKKKCGAVLSVKTFLQSKRKPPSSVKKKGKQFWTVELNCIVSPYTNPKTQGGHTVKLTSDRLKFKAFSSHILGSLKNSTSCSFRQFWAHLKWLKSDNIKL